MMANIIERTRSQNAAQELDEDQRLERMLKHIEHEHSMWAYLNFIIFLKEQDQDDDDGLEFYVRHCMNRTDIGWFPTNKSLTLNAHPACDPSTGECYVQHPCPKHLIPLSDDACFSRLAPSDEGEGDLQTEVLTHAKIPENKLIQHCLPPAEETEDEREARFQNERAFGL